VPSSRSSSRPSWPRWTPCCRAPRAALSADAKRLAYIYARARNRYKDTAVLGKDVGAKVRKLIDDHVISMGIDPKIPPMSADRCRI
jgi:hypothetical protein